MIATIVGYITSIIGTLGENASGAVSWIGQYVTAIVSNPLLLFFVVFGFVGTGIGLIHRIIRLN